MFNPLYSDVKGSVLMEIAKDYERIKHYLDAFEMSDVFSDELIEQMTLTTFEKGEDIITLDTQMENFYILVEGKLKVYTLQENGKKVLIRFYNPKSIMGDLEYLTNYPIKAIVESLRHSTLITVPMDILKKHTIDCPQFLRFVIQNLSHKLYTFSNMSSLNLVYPLENRLASYLVSISEISSHDRINEIKVYNMEEMADLLCASYRHLSRVLSDFEQRGILIRNRGNIKIIDFDTLIDLSVGIFE